MQLVKGVHLYSKLHAHVVLLKDLKIANIYGDMDADGKMRKG